MATFFTSDHHHLHKVICDFTDRPWTNEENTEHLIKRWNQQVQPKDHVYHLGDFTFAGSSRFDEVWDILVRLNGNKHFIFGNHCRRNLWKMIEEKAQEKNQPIHLLGHYHEMKIDKINIVLSHYPHREWNRKHYGAIMLFGHCHGSLYVEGERTMDVGIDNHPDHLLFSWAEVKERMLSIPKPCIDHHKREIK